MAMALRLVRLHLDAVARKEGGRLLPPTELRQVMLVAKTMGTMTKRGKPLKAELVGKSPKDLLEDAMKFPEVREAMAALTGGGR